MGQSRPKPCGCSSNAFLSGDVCGAAHGRRTLLSAFTAHVGSSGGTAGRARVRRAPEAPASRALVGATPPASALPGLPIATGLAPRSAPQFPQLCEDRDPSCGGCWGSAALEHT